MDEVFTIGHGTRSSQELIEVLSSARIDVLIDVRRFPGSRRHPHLAQEALGKDLEAAGIDYEWWGEALGGRRRGSADSPHVAWRNAGFRAYADHMASDEFRGALEELEKRAAERRQALMCAETLWWRCHRRLISDALVSRGFEVVHLGAGKDEARHELHEAARILPGGGLVYDLEPQGRLEL